MIELLALLPFLISFVFVAIVLRRIHRVVTLVRNPERFGEDLAGHVAQVLRQTGVDPSEVRVEALRELDALPPEERDAARARLVRALFRGELGTLGSEAGPGASSATDRFGVTGGSAFDRRPPPIDAGSRSALPWVAIAVVTIVGLAAVLWMTNGVPA